MSVLIRGMDMPEYCWDCPCSDGEDGICQVTRNFYEDKRPHDCPLVEVKTPHGRLIDESSIKYDSVAVRSMDDGHIWHELCVCKDVIEDLPTVLEAEE